MKYILLLLIVCFSAQLQAITSVAFLNKTLTSFKLLLNRGILSNGEQLVNLNGQYPILLVCTLNLLPEGLYDVRLDAQRQDIFATPWGILQADEETILFNGKEYSPRDSFANLWFIMPDGTLQPYVPSSHNNTDQGFIK
ncbi:hypothetical protein M1466_00695 [Candidatus Dependentiae bacterium]|nr:hypothetical protein [Candidatus Dependentiae bacterium]